MMDSELQQYGNDATARISSVLDRGQGIRHADIRAAVNAVVAFRNRVIEKCRERAASADCLNQANALVSLAYGAEFPLSGLHRNRLEQTRRGMMKLLNVTFVDG